MEKKMKFLVQVFFVTTIIPFKCSKELLEPENNVDIFLSSSLTSALSTSSISSITKKHLGFPSNLDQSMAKVDTDNFNDRCEEITIPMCKGIGYNFTEMPNELNHDTQEEAGLEVHQFWPLVEIKCSMDLKFFLCSMYTPICLPEYTKPLPVCKSVCERARSGCAPLMEQYGFSWPERMNCERLPVQGDPNQLCMEQENHSQFLTTDKSVNSVSLVPIFKPTKPSKHSHISKCKQGKNQKNCQQDYENEKKDCSCQCRPPLISLVASGINQNNSFKVFNRYSSTFTSSFKYTNNTNDINCVLPCQGAFLTKEERSFTVIWLTLWSGFCAISTLATIITFLIDSQRFKYPERPIVFLSSCYFFVSVGYLSRVVVGYEKIICDGSLLKYGLQGPGICITVFLLIYYFGMASSVWWVILAFTWFLAAGLKWGNEAISSYSQYFHLAAWITPTTQTVWVILNDAVAGDPVAGVCTVAPEFVTIFILAPLFIYLITGTTFLLTGFISLFRIRSVIKRQSGAKADKLEKLMIRIGIFSILYTVPAGTVLTCYLYENTFRNDWINSLACPCEPRIKPMYSILMLKYFMALAVGITSGVWIWSGKTLDSWRRLWQNLFGRKPEATLNTAAVINTCTIENYTCKDVTNRSLPQHPSILEVESALLQQTTASNISQHHIHHQVLKQLPLSHV